MARKRHISPQTRVKLSQAAKKRRRGLKGTSLGGKFLAGAAFTTRYRSEGRLSVDDDNPKSAGGGHKGRKSRQEDPRFSKEIGPEVYTRAKRKVEQHPEAAAQEIARTRINKASGRYKEDPNKESVTRADMGHEPVRINSGAQKEINEMMKEAHWKSDRGTYETPRPKTARRFFADDLAPSHRKEVDRLLNDPTSNFNAKGNRYNNEARYARWMQEGYSHDEAYRMLGEERRGRPRSATQAGPSRTRTAGTKRNPSRKSRYESTAPTSKEFQFGVSARAIDSIEQLRRDNPLATEAELVRMRQTQREDHFAELLKNQKWAHETERANVLSEKGGKLKEDSDRVVFFTTNVGSPAPSVPADSLVGQYIIRKRKKMLKEAGVPKTQLRGAFPAAVRDMHLFERSFGVQYAIEGRHGTYKQSGWRYRNKTSRGYGKPTPVGSQIMYDSQGVPMYDEQGNIRFTEGATRGFRAETPLTGLRIFIG